MLSTPTIVTFMSVNRSEESPVDPGRGVGNCGATYGEEGSLQAIQTQWKCNEQLLSLWVNNVVMVFWKKLKD